MAWIAYVEKLLLTCTLALKEHSCGKIVRGMQSVTNDVPVVACFTKGLGYAKEGR
jgi:hypothetical protein